MVAASVLRASGFNDVSDVLGGYGAWQAAGLPVAGGAEAERRGSALTGTQVEQSD